MTLTIISIIFSVVAITINIINIANIIKREKTFEKNVRALMIEDMKRNSAKYEPCNFQKARCTD